MSNHTPGPWKVARQNGDGLEEYEGLVGVTGPAFTTKAGKQVTLYICQYIQPENAKIIAESPEMYQIIQRLATCDWMSEKELSMWARKSREIMERINK
jgi:hypothetical protein